MNNTFFALAAAATISLSAYSADVYVDANSTAPAPDGSSSAPYSTIAAGVAAAGTNDVVHVAGGADRTYAIAATNDLIVITQPGLKIACDGRKANVEIGTMASAFVVSIARNATNVIVSGLSFRFSGGALGSTGRVVDVSGNDATIEGCEFIKTGEAAWTTPTGGEHSGCIIGSQADQNHKTVGERMKVVNCLFQSIRSVNDSRLIVCSQNQKIVGNDFIDCASVFSGLKQGGDLLTFVSNRMIRCESLRTNGYGNYGEVPTAEVAYNIFRTETALPFIVKGGNGFTEYPVRIHHNTIVGASALVEVGKNASDVTYLLQPEIFDNLIVLSNAGCMFNELASKLNGSSCSSFKAGGKGTFRNNVYLADSLSGGPLQLAVGYDLAAGAVVEGNHQLGIAPTFISDVHGSEGYCQLIEDAYPWVTATAWTNDGAYPAYVGALPPAEPSPEGEPFLSEISLTRTGNRAYSVSGSLVQGSAQIVISARDKVFELAGGSTVSARYDFNSTVAVPALDADAIYDVVVTAQGATATATQAVAGVVYTGEIAIAGAGDAAEKGLVAGAFTVFRAISAAATRLPHTIRYTVTGAAGGVDFATLPGRVTIPAGESSAQISVIPILNTSASTNTTVTITLDAGNYELTEGGRSASIQIKNYTTATGNIYVDANHGEDPAADGTIEHPFATIKEALDVAITTGDVVRVFSDGRHYEITSPADTFGFAYPCVTLQPHEPGGIIDLVVSTDFATAAATDNPNVIRIEEAATNVTIKGVHFRYGGSGANQRQNNSLGKAGHLLWICGNFFVLDGCTVSYEGSIGGYGGDFVICSAAEQHAQGYGYGMTIRNCGFENVQSTTEGKRLIKLSAFPKVVGNTFTNCMSAVFALKENGALISIVSNTFVNCKALCSVSGHSGEFQQGEIAYNVVVTPDGVPFIDKRNHGLSGTGGAVKIHHNTVIGGPLVRVMGSYESDALPGWAPWIFDNLIIDENGDTLIQEMSTSAFMGATYSSSFETGKGAFFRNNAYWPDMTITGGSATNLSNYNLSLGLEVVSNSVCSAPCRFVVTDDLHSKDFYRPKGVFKTDPIRSGGWTDDGRYPAYIGALGPVGTAPLVLILR